MEPDKRHEAMKTRGRGELMGGNRISVIGTGYVGLVGGVCLADFGNFVINADIDQGKIKKLKAGEIPIYEPGLQEIFDRVTQQGRIDFTTDLKKALDNSEIIFIAVGTPPQEDGSVDLKYVLEVAREIGRNISEHKIVVNKSTVPVGTGQVVKKTIEQELKRRGAKTSFDVVSNPEFLREGKAVFDFTHPDRIVIGTESKEAQEKLQEVYRPLYLNNTPFMFCNMETAELIKYACNAFLATKISFINEMANLCEKVNANIKDVARAMGMDGRISPKFLHPGPGYGGSCFPKDTRAIVKIAEANGVQLKTVKAVIETNEAQKFLMVDKIVSKMGPFQGKTLAILGLTFKPETDDMREAPSLTIIPEIIRQGARVRVFDPEGFKEAFWRLQSFADNITYCNSEYEAAEGAHALIIITEWNQFRKMDLNRISRLLQEPYFFDLRNIYTRKEVLNAGLNYIGVGIPDNNI